MDAITITNLRKTFRGKQAATVHAVRDLCLDIKGGEVFGFLGPNGAGKSTTIKMLMGLIRPTAGSIAILGSDGNNPAARRHVGYLPENPSFYDYLSAEEYLRFTGHIFGMSKASLRARCQEVLERVDLVEASRRPIRSYSKGMVQRLGIAQTLIHAPKVFILDEPMSGLDPIGRALVKELIRELRAKGCSVFFSSHITADMEEVCDRVGIIAQGSLITVDSVRTILNSGIDGYRVLYHTLQGEGLQEKTSSPTELTGLLDSLSREGCEVHLVEPQRRSLESFFLDTVKATCAPSV